MRATARSFAPDAMGRCYVRRLATQIPALWNGGARAARLRSGVVRSGARTPEELEALFEDAFVTRDRDAVAALFEEGAVLIAGEGRRQARGSEEIARLAAAMWQAEATYLAEPRRVLQARDTALVVAERSLNVARRGSDGAWRYAISLVSLEGDQEEEQ